MQYNLSPVAKKVVSNVAVSFFLGLTLISFLFSVDISFIVILLSIMISGFALYLLWIMNESDAASLLIFFFGTTVCFYLFSEVIVSEWLRAFAVVGFAVLAFVLSNYLINLTHGLVGGGTLLYKLALAIIFTEIFWVISFFTASQVSKGAITALLFYNFLSPLRDIMGGRFNIQKFAILSIINIILLAIVFIKI